MNHHSRLAGCRSWATPTLQGGSSRQRLPSATFTMWFGHRRAVVVDSWEVDRECRTTHDRAMAGRPQVAASKFVGYDHSMMIIAPYGPVLAPCQEACHCRASIGQADRAAQACPGPRDQHHRSSALQNISNKQRQSTSLREAI